MKCEKCGVEMRRVAKTEEDGTVTRYFICENKQCPKYTKYTKETN